MSEEQTRKNVLGKILNAIRKFGFSSRDLSVPHHTDAIFILLSVDDFPVNISFVKLVILCYVAEIGKATRKDIAAILTKDYSTIAHNLIDLVKEGYLSVEGENKKNVTKYYSITPAGEAIFSNFVSFYQKKIVETSEKINKKREQ